MKVFSGSRGLGIWDRLTTPCGHGGPIGTFPRAHDAPLARVSVLLGAFWVPHDPLRGGRCQNGALGGTAVLEAAAAAPGRSGR